MADLSERQYTAEYTGLATNVYLALAVGGACLLAFETMRQVPRARGRPSSTARQAGWWRRARPPAAAAPAAGSGSMDAEKAGEGGWQAVDREAWEWGYIYQARHWAVPSQPLLPRWPLVWIWDALQVPEASLPERCGLDHAVHSRFLRCCFWFLLLQTLTTLPVLLPIHLKYAPASIARSSMARASLAALTTTPEGRRYLWVHMVCIVWMLASWVLGLVWVAWGGLRYRREGVERTLERAREAAQAHAEPPPRSSPTHLPPSHPPAASAAAAARAPRGWRQRTLRVANVPPDLRAPGVLRAYFEDGLRGVLERRRARAVRAGAKGAGKRRRRREGEEGGETQGLTDDNPSDDEDDADGCSLNPAAAAAAAADTPIVEEVVLVRRLLELHRLRARRAAVLGQLEEAHVALGRGVLRAVARWRTREGRAGQAEEEEAKGGGQVEGGYGYVSGWTEAERMGVLEGTLGRFLDVEEDGFWTALHSLPRALLDPYQPLRYSQYSPLVLLRRRPNPARIDYLAAKLALLSAYIDEQLARPLHDFPAGSEAFLTFATPELARLAVRKMGRHSSRALCCNASMAPDWRDIEHLQLMKKEFRTDAFKGAVVSIVMWAFTIVWVIPISLLVTLISVKNLALIIPALKDALDKHPRAARVATSIVPTILVSILSLLIPLLLFLISTHLETIVTKSALHDVILNRYWRFVAVNLVVLFCVGQAALRSFIVNFREELLSIRLLERIASSFPQAAPFYAGWLILETSLHSFFELGMLGLPLLQWLFARRKDTAPRKRSAGTHPRFFSAYYLIPIHTVCLFIALLFGVLNPLVLPFGLLYFAVAHVILKHQFIHVYQSQYDTLGLRPAVRFLRYTLDGLIMTEVVFMAMNVILRKPPLIAISALLVIITGAIKVSLTRAIKARFAALDRMEADGLFEISLGTGCEGHGEVAPPSPASSLTRLPAGPPDGEGTRVPARLFRAWRLRTERAKLRQQSAGGRKTSLSLRPLRLALDEEEEDEAESEKEDGEEKEEKEEQEGGEGRVTPARKKTLSRRMQQMSSHMVHPFLERLDARFMPPTPTLLSQSSPVTDSSISPVSPSAPLRPDPSPAPLDHRARDQLTTPHPGVQPWADFPADDVSYAYQPAYSDPIPSTLWLPRHPLSTLDLEDTVDLMVAIESSKGGKGQIGKSDLFAGAETEEEQEDGEDDVGGMEAYESPEALEGDVDGLESEAATATSPRRPSTSPTHIKDYFLAGPVRTPLETSPSPSDLSPHASSGATPTTSRVVGPRAPPSRSTSHPLSPFPYTTTLPRRPSAHRPPRPPLSPSSFRPPSHPPETDPPAARRPLRPRGPRGRSSTVGTALTAASSGGGSASSAGAGGGASDFVRELLAEEALRVQRDREEEAQTLRREGTRQRLLGRRGAISGAVGRADAA